MNYHHFIITRFNVNIYAIDFPKRLEDIWLSLRFELFQKYCFPTVQAQGNQNFTWLVLFDEQTPDRYKIFTNIYAKYRNFIPVYCGAFNSIMSQTIRTMQKIAPDAEWFLTTRLDNDDALSTGFVQCLHGVVDSLNEDDLKPSDTLYINFPNGLQFCDGEFYDFKDATNAFVSLLERRDNPHTVFWVDHPSIYDMAPVIQAETGPLWLQVVHDLNVYNYVRGKKVEMAGVESRFPCDFENDESTKENGP
ncbi:hypothetical protein SYK_23520 [Pseudodesulfovibrio nedwellii]|uniref:Uncharacterized protein n=1 Tax=Pseudodesulfovibrio nedwellii TaxID=2973072 RepID=A0ABN6S459_9BACT|nr:glycosyltransferase [Pseudodesulfovibrio nedwellii]BDQ37992.1 hypothetical protein SYK_23520 [Pseudodesulfovibrio nedwellii]